MLSVHGKNNVDDTRVVQAVKGVAQALSFDRTKIVLTLHMVSGLKIDDIVRYSLIALDPLFVIDCGS